MITFAAFHMDVPQDVINHIHTLNSTATFHADPHIYIAATLDSCRALHPGCRTVVLSDTRTPFPSSAGFEVVRCEGLDAAQLMHSRSTAWVSFLETAGSHVIFLDSDILVQTKLEPLFAEPFDGGLTYRNYDQWPINAGIQFFHRDRLARGVDFLRQCLAIFEQKYRETSAWGGDQDALRDMTAGAEIHRTDTHRWRSPNGYDLLLLPCAEFNFSTPGETMPGPYPGIPVLHFKGMRKQNMLPYWEQYLKASGGIS